MAAGLAAATDSIVYYRLRGHVKCVTSGHYHARSTPKPRPNRSLCGVTETIHYPPEPKPSTNTGPHLRVETIEEVRQSIIADGGKYIPGKLFGRRYKNQVPQGPFVRCVDCKTWEHRSCVLCLADTPEQAAAFAKSFFLKDCVVYRCDDCQF
ncbi:hypothetical protein OHC33_004181 [Knufia fluminis]|uniref:Uncharacterized protein n=1 Tax=Knufia fluminis TaxID=191047 RepID=A0AAN8EFH4_9EURO|nr:hypothetical protein OHC33_004181 [Knufia fluminis]